MEILAGLDTFVALARTGSVAAAARSLGVPRSTVTRRLERLEEELGMPLLERNTRGVRLTEAGRLLLAGGRPLVASLRALREDVQQLQGVVRGPLRVSAPPGLGTDFFIEFLHGLRERAPALEPDLIIRDGVPDLLEEDLDIAFCEGPLDDMPWIANPIGPADRMVVASGAYLARRGVPAVPTDLAAHDCLGLRSVGDRPGLWPLRAGGSVSVAPVLRSNDMQILRQAAVAGLGVALLPVYVVGPDLLGGQLTPLLPEIGRSATLLALTTRRRSDSARLHAFFSLLEDFVSRYTAAAADGPSAPR